MGYDSYHCAANLVRSWASRDEPGIILSSFSATEIISGFALALNMPEEELCEKLSKFYEATHPRVDIPDDPGRAVDQIKRLFPTTSRLDVEPKEDECDDYRGADYD